LFRSYTIFYFAELFGEEKVKEFEQSATTQKQKENELDVVQTGEEIQILETQVEILPKHK
jgi:hypothetical protein